jgi:hypothetical protein
MQLNTAVIYFLNEIRTYTRTLMPVFSIGGKYPFML